MFIKIDTDGLTQTPCGPSGTSSFLALRAPRVLYAVYLSLAASLANFSAFSLVRLSIPPSYLFLSAQYSASLSVSNLLFSVPLGFVFFNCSCISLFSSLPYCIRSRKLARVSGSKSCGGRGPHAQAACSSAVMSSAGREQLRKRRTGGGGICLLLNSLKSK